MSRREIKDITEVDFESSFNDLSTIINDISVDNGFTHIEDEYQAAALIHSEVSEMLEADRNHNPPDDHIPEFSSIEAEYADIIIRIMDRGKFKGYDIAGAIIEKIKYNACRPCKHGGKKY